MCGICGVLNLDGQPVDEGMGQRMMDLLWHRGPDDSGSMLLQTPTSPVQDKGSHPLTRGWLPGLQCLGVVGQLHIPR